MATSLVWFAIMRNFQVDYWVGTNDRKESTALIASIFYVFTTFAMMKHYNRSVNNRYTVPRAYLHCQNSRSPNTSFYLCWLIQIGGSEFPNIDKKKLAPNLILLLCLWFQLKAVSFILNQSSLHGKSRGVVSMHVWYIARYFLPDDSIKTFSTCS